MLECECKVSIEGDNMRHNGWRAIGGADPDGTQHYALVAFDGPNIHGWVQSVRPGGGMHGAHISGVGYASANLDDIEEDFKKHVTAAGGDVMRFIGADAEISGQVYFSIVDSDIGQSGVFGICIICDMALTAMVPPISWSG